jgi:Ser/Thr protein kinase RdoA (MazF antagonist)
MRTLASLIDARGEPNERALENALFETTDAHVVAGRLEDFVASHLGAVEEPVFYTSSVGVVVGLRLTSGAEVVVKVHRWGVTAERLVAVQKVQEFVTNAGVPAPRPLVGPTPLGTGLATVEEMLSGERADGHSARVRTALAAGLLAFVEAALPLNGRVDVSAPLVLQDWGPALWPEPHDLRFDFDATTPGAEWIDELARAARRALQVVGPGGAIGHFDWRVGNLGFAGAKIVAVYDWDSLACAPEPVIVGCAAAQFSSDWTATKTDTLPTTEEMRAFVRDYETARGAPFTAQESGLLDAANLWTCAYGARCQHSDEVLSSGPQTDERTAWTRLLGERGEGAF